MSFVCQGKGLGSKRKDTKGNVANVYPMSVISSDNRGRETEVFFFLTR